MITRCYLEITNCCNLDCAFCPKNERKKRFLSTEEFDLLTDKLQGKIQFLYFHLMGEPMLHPEMPVFITKAREKGFLPVLTTNGTLFPSDLLLQSNPHKVQISLHSHEGNGKDDPEVYMKGVMEYAVKAAANGTIVVLRLWNQGGMDSANELIKDLAAKYVPMPWTERYDGWKLAEKIYLEFDQKFEWPEEDREEYGEDEVFCYALRNQIGVLVDGTVVPCCLDHEGNISLGNLFENSLEDILDSPRAKAMYDGFSKHIATEPLCRRCGYAAVSKRFRKEKNK